VKVPVGYGIDDISGDNKMHVQDVMLSEGQRRVLTMVVEDERSIFFTGSAGNVTYARISIFVFPFLMTYMERIQAQASLYF